MPRHLSTTATLSLFLPMLASGTEDGDSAIPLFASQDILDITIEAPLKMLMKERPDEEELPGKLIVTADDGSLRELDVAIRTRGKFRRQRSTCPFAPLRLNLKEAQTGGTVFDKQDKLKLVTHCRNRSSRYQQTVVSEYLAYRLLNLITDISFRARLLRVTYKYSDADTEIVSYAVLLENKDRLAKRIDIPSLVVRGVEVSQVQPVHLNLTSMHQYLIGNTDFSPKRAAEGLDCCHNYELFAEDGGPVYAVPYDFDQAGLVDAPHAAPNPHFKLRSTRQRLYRGRCANNEHLPDSRRLYRENHDAIVALVNEQPGLDAKTKKSSLAFVGKFYDILNDEQRFEREIVKKCI